MWVAMKPQRVVEGQSEETSGLEMVGKGIWSTIHFFPLFFQLQAVIQEETDGPGLLIHGSVAGAIATILVFLIMGWSTWHQACWQQMGFTFLKGGRDSLLMS